MLQWVGEILGRAAFKAGGAAVNSVEWRQLAIGAIVCALVCGFIGSKLGVPADPGFTGSILCGPSPVRAVVAVAIAFAITMMVGGVAMLLISDEAGLICTCAGLGALAVRGGSIRSVLQVSSGSSVFVALMIESGILFAMIFAASVAFRFALGKIRRKSDVELLAPGVNETADAPLGTKLSTLGVQVAVMAVCEIVLIQTDSKAQALAGVGIAGFLGSFAAYLLFAQLPEGIWFWAGPSVLAVLGYLLAILNPAGLGVGEVHGWAAPLARATPLDYASIGTAAAILGHWSGRRQAHPEDEPLDEESQPAPL